MNTANQLAEFAQIQINIFNLIGQFSMWDFMCDSDLQGTYYGDYGWVRNAVYDFELIYEPNRVRITIDATLIFDISGEFRPGRFGFYNYSQPGVNYQEFRLNEAPVAVDDYYVTWEDSSLAMHVILNDMDADGHDKIITHVGETIPDTVLNQGSALQGLLFKPPNGEQIQKHVLKLNG